jgi:hypothetical protein
MFDLDFAGKGEYARRKFVWDSVLGGIRNGFHGEAETEGGHCFFTFGHSYTAVYTVIAQSVKLDSDAL